MSGTGRRRKPPVGEEGGEQYTPPSSEQYPDQSPGQSSGAYPQYQTYAQPAEPQYDYDWRQQGAAAYEPPAQPQAQPQPQAPPLSQSAQYGYDPYQSYEQQPSSVADVLGSGGYQIPQQQQPAAPTARPRPEPRPEPQSAPAAAPAAPAPAEPAFEFEFDLDDDEPGTASPPVSAAAPVDPAASAAPTSTATRPADKDGYRPDDFAFVDAADDPDVNGWLDFSESRADTRAERLRKMRVRLIALGCVLALAAAGVGVYMWLGGSVPGLNSQAAATKSMILFRLDDAAGDSVGDALMVTKRGGSTDGTASGTGALVIIPAQMQIDDQGFGDQPFGGNMASDEPPAGSDEVAGALGVTPDGVWTMDETTFGIFVDELGGVSLTTNTAVPASTADPKGVTQGTVTLSGAQAVAYATYTASGEAATAQAARFGQVLNALVANIPAYPVSVEAYLTNLGLIPDPSLPISKLGPILAALAAQQNAGRVTVATLPLTSGDALNATAAAAIVSKLLGGTAKAGASAGQAARVLVQNGTGASTSSSGKLTAAAQAKLENAGYTYNAGNTVATQSTTKVEVASSADQSLAEQVAASLGLSGSAVQVVSGLSSVDDVTVVLGQDWTSLSAD